MKPGNGDRGINPLNGNANSAEGIWEINSWNYEVVFERVILRGMLEKNACDGSQFKLTIYSLYNKIYPNAS